MRRDFYSCAEVAQKFRVQITTVWSWVRLGKLKAEKLPGTKEYRIYPDDLREFEKTLKYKT